MATEAFKQPAAQPMGPAPHPMAAVVAPDPGPAYAQVPLKSLRLRAGMFLQTQRLEKNSPTYEAQFLGAIDDKCLFVVPVGTFSIKTGMKANETFVVRGFTGQYDFHFVAKVIQAFDFTFREPAYAYAVLSFPDVVKARKVRNSVRIKTSLPATATPRSGAASVDATIVDLSVDGALLSSAADLGAVGDLVNIAFSIGPDDERVYVEALARICHAQPGPEETRLSGVLFENIGDRDRLRIREFVVEAVE
jgi:hypothetical protein